MASFHEAKTVVHTTTGQDLAIFCKEKRVISKARKIKIFLNTCTCILNSVLGDKVPY